MEYNTKIKPIVTKLFKRHGELSFLLVLKSQSYFTMP